MVFITRYLDLFTHYYSLYNSVMKILYITISVAVVYVLRFKEPWRTSYDSVRDDFPHWKFLALPCFCAALVINDGYLKYGVLSYMREVRLYARACVPLRLTQASCRFCGRFPSTWKLSRSGRNSCFFNA